MSRIKRLDLQPNVSASQMLDHLSKLCARSSYSCNCLRLVWRPHSSGHVVVLLSTSVSNFFNLCFPQTQIQLQLSVVYLYFQIGDVKTIYSELNGFKRYWSLSLFSTSRM